MPNPIKATSKIPQGDDLKNSQVVQDQGVPVQKGPKEHEPVKSEVSAAAEEEQLMAEIRTTAESADKQALESLQSSMADIKRGESEPELSPDVEDAGVVSPAKAAEDVVVKGPTIVLPIDENGYEKGLKTQVSGKTDNENSVSGVSAVVALALWVGRLLKLAHKHTMKVVFKKEGSK